MLLTTTITAGNTLEFYEDADFFRLLDSASAITVRFYKQGAEVARAESVGEGYAEKFERGTFDRIQIDSAATQTIQFVTRLGNVVSYDTPPVGNVAVTNNNGSFDQVSHTISTTSSTLRSSNPNRRYLLIQNRSSTETLYVNLEGNTASTTSGLQIDPGGMLELATFVPTNTITARTGSASSSQIVTVEG